MTSMGTTPWGAPLLRAPALPPPPPAPPLPYPSAFAPATAPGPASTTQPRAGPAGVAGGPEASSAGRWNGGGPRGGVARWVRRGGWCALTTGPLCCSTCTCPTGGSARREAPPALQARVPGSPAPESEPPAPVPAPSLSCPVPAPAPALPLPLPCPARAAPLPQPDHELPLAPYRP